MKGDRERCLASGFDDYLAKPFGRDELHAVLGRWLSGQRGSPIAPPADEAAVARVAAAGAAA
jgi:DNA-binding response OmpR family regulator